jgi:hypothetical protein
MQDRIGRLMQLTVSRNMEEEKIDAEVLRDPKEGLTKRDQRRTEIARQQQEREQKQAKWRAEAAIVEKYAVHDEASLVTCSAGLDVWHVVTGFDLCKMRIKNLPKDSKEKEIADMLAEKNVPFPEFLITRHHTTRDTSEASVLVGKEVGRTLALELDGLVFRGQVLSVEVSDHTTRHAMLFVEQTSPYLTVSWKGQTDTLIASYPSREEAAGRAKELNGMLWKGERLAASLNQPQRASSTKSVKITRYPPDAPSDMEFLNFIGTQSYRILKTKPYNHQCTLIMVRIQLRQQNGVRMDTYKELTSTADVDETRIRVHFDDWENVKRAHATFHRKKLGTRDETTPTLRASFSRPFQYSVEISRRQFQAQERQWDALKEIKRAKEAYLYTTQVGNTVGIYVLGYDSRTSGALKVRIEKLAAGEALDANHWHSNFASNGKQFFKGVHDETGIHIKVDSAKQSLKVFGEPERVAEACSLIQAEVQRLRSTDTTDRRTADHEEDYSLVGERVNDGRIEYSFSEDRPGLWTPRKHFCVVCYCEASVPEHLGCGHAYCAGCLQHLLASAADTKKFPITCIGNDATCDSPLPIPVIRRLMDNQAFQHLVEVAFTCHLEQHPEEYRYCITPDCKQIYRFRRKEVWQCPSCLLKVCPTCEEDFHEGLSCEEMRLQRDPALMERLNESLGYRKCPQCSAWIEKLGGCNHITCKCGSHICWRCMGHFPVGEIYKHLSKARCKVYKPLPQTQKSVQLNHPVPAVRGKRCPGQRAGDGERQGLEMRCRTRERDPRGCVIM